MFLWRPLQVVLLPLPAINDRIATVAGAEPADIFTNINKIKS